MDNLKNRETHEAMKDENLLNEFSGIDKEACGKISTSCNQEDDNLVNKRLRMDGEVCDQRDTICNPISELSSLWTYALNPPNWADQIVALTPRGSSVVKNVLLDCHVESNKFNSSTRLDAHSVPRTLVCHDMKGGYLEDKYVNAVNCGNGYTFYRWAQIDVFVYFSHHLLTIPPLSWINIAHTNGVKILGTFITEWIPGEEICRELFASEESVNKLVEALVEICIIFKLDGWLINIENKIEDVVLLKKFVRDLTEQLHIKKSGSLIIWYDSVINDGKLKWQNELNSSNRCFFDVCDGIFLNYTWNEENLKHTVAMAEHRQLDVYVGVDVFGRNFYGGGNFNTHMAVQKIREYNLSMAIFAQGWTHETLAIEPQETLLNRFFDRDNAFWRSLWPYLYTHPVNTMFETFFYTGVDKEWFNLHSQEMQLSRFLHPQDCLAECKDVVTLRETCNCLQLSFCGNHTSCLISKEKFDQNYMYVHHLFSCDINVKGKVVFYYYSKLGELLNFILLVKNNNESFKKIICYASNKEILTEDCSVTEVNPSKEQSLINLVSHKHKIPTHWELRCYLLNLENCKILEIGAEISKNDAVCLCGIGIKSIS